MKAPTPTTWATMACALSWAPSTVAFLPPVVVAGSLKQVSMLHTEVDAFVCSSDFYYAAYLGGDVACGLRVARPALYSRMLWSVVLSP